MTKKGFTLIELLGVIILIALISLIIIPGISSVLKNGKIKADETLNDDIILATKNWAVDNKDKLPGDGNYTLVTLEQLQKDGYIDNKIVKPSTGEEIDKVCVRIKNQNKVYYYDFDGECNSKIESILTTKYKCLEGYTLNDSKQCVKTWTETTLRNEDKDYYCTQPDYQVSGSSCIKVVPVQVSKVASYSCPSGYSRQGTTCTKKSYFSGYCQCHGDGTPTCTTYQESCAAGGGTVILTTHHGCGVCNEGFTGRVACDSGYCQYSRSATFNGYVCPSGSYSSGSNCYKNTTTSMDAAYTFVYSCPSGYTSSGSGSTMTCSKEVTDTKNPTSRQVYDCPKDYTLIGDENNKESYCIK